MNSATSEPRVACAREDERNASPEMWPAASRAEGRLPVGCGNERGEDKEGRLDKKDTPLYSADAAATAAAVFIAWNQPGTERRREMRDSCRGT